ncbi:16S rRNA (adenine(1518)-N(6)/adenine(1519)-N(6))-dimethyltransferase RsmA [Facilibium subflavum]|uniref:16S rRNA (adenine(1518)-N(6)/adenine(1519)-N(6))- dimethyltransferase RsmA n=1 Tax=Facilibium subflavum TaxID=2219058 RepID=UPI001F3F2489|nr:16S rRNA (adenine(1518)-N(6)/adenine(1519)-N(6))-dimethyltransferase RsmA [Facilibium subflavum]
MSKVQHKAKKSLGQNFLNDQNIIHNIISKARIKPDDQVIEIGPGLGALTQHILAITKQLTVIEFDRDVIPLLQEKCQDKGDLHIIHKDVLKVDFNTLYQEKKIKLIGNLPYNISSPILFHLIGFSHLFKDMHFMLQKEVVDRIVASPGNKNYGRLSIMLQYHFDCQGLFDVPASAFTPAPKVTSRILRLIPYDKKPYIANDYALFSSMVKQTFQQRRKTLRNTLKNMISDPQQLQNAPIDLSRRPESLSVSEFVQLTNFFES